MREQHFPRLYATASTGKTKWWEIYVRSGPLGSRENEAEIVIWYGYEGQDENRIQATVRRVTEGKNLGRSNETTPFEQACLEAEAMWQKKCDKKYSTTPAEKSQILLPMLAHDFKKRGHHIEFPAFVQPKLNGVRCLARKASADQIEFISRGGKSFQALQHLGEALLSVMEVGWVFDGELFSQKMTFQQIVSAVKREQEDTTKIEYWIYDAILEGAPYEERMKLLHAVRDRNLVVFSGNPLRVLWTELVAEAEDLREQHNKNVALGFEGSIIRNRQGLYRCDFRSPDLQKYKDMVDSEFLIVGGKEGTGRATGTIIWRCLTEEGKEFDVRPKGTEEQRRYWWENLNQFIGKKLTVQYQQRSDTGVPIFPVGISIRDYE